MPRSTNFEELVLDGISLKKSASDKLEVNSVVLADADDISSVDLRINAQETNRSEDVDSLDTRVSLEESTETAKVGSVDTRVGEAEDDRSTDVDSLDTRVSLEESTETAKVGSVDTRVGAQESKRSEDVVSIDTRLTAEAASTQISLDIPISGNASHLDVNFSSAGYSNGDSVVVYGAIRDAQDSSSNPIIASQISGANSHNSVTFIFSDAIPENTSSIIHSQNSDYVMDCIFKQENQN